MTPEQIRPLLKQIDVPPELKKLDKQTRYEIDTCILQGMQIAEAQTIIKCIKALEEHENHCQNCADDNISMAIAIINKMK